MEKLSGALRFTEIRKGRVTYIIDTRRLPEEITSREIYETYVAVFKGEERVGSTITRGSEIGNSEQAIRNHANAVRVVTEKKNFRFELQNLGFRSTR